MTLRQQLIFWRTFAIGMTIGFWTVIALSQPYHTPLDTTTNELNGCTVIHSWAYTNSGYQVPVLQGAGMSGVMKEFVFIGKETTNSPQIDPVVYLIGLTDFDAIRTVGVMPWQETPIYYKVFTLDTGLKMERLTSVNDGCGIDSTNFVRFTLPIGVPIPVDVWWILFYPDECKHRWAIPPIQGTNGPKAYLAARFYSQGWRYFFGSLPGGHQTIAYSISLFEQVKKTETLGPLRIEPLLSNTVRVSWPQTNLTDLKLWSNAGWNIQPSGNRVTLPATNGTETFWLERRKQ